MFTPPGPGDQPMNVFETPEASLDLDALPDEQFDRVWESINELAKNPFPNIAVCLDSRGNIWRILVHRVRLVYSLDDRGLLVRRVVRY